MTNAKRPTGPSMPGKEVVRLGKEIYMRDILPIAKDDHFGEYLAIERRIGRLGNRRDRHGRRESSERATPLRG